MVVEDSAGAYGVILDGHLEQCSPRLPVPVGYDSLLTNDRRWVVQLADEGGSEVATYARSRPTAARSST